jgi:hypothetical protein
VTKRRILNPAATGTITLEEARALIREVQRERTGKTHVAGKSDGGEGKGVRGTRATSGKKK